MTKATASVFESSLEAVAITGVDIVPLFFARFFIKFPEQNENFNRPSATHGSMVNEMLLLLSALASQEGSVDAMIEDCVARHHSYGDIAIAHFIEAYDLLMDTIKTAAGSSWNIGYTQAWAALLADLRQRITHLA